MFRLCSSAFPPWYVPCRGSPPSLAWRHLTAYSLSMSSPQFHIRNSCTKTSR
nr:MAG TPA: hypothetical protein [Caudoviricetes sp.]